ncbi:CPBP family intramembrane glutamic endopeptidase [Ruminiclostridium papyrosolvens]|uniref:CAAX amino terminal protease n=1 Tax=Ruminiclostridium papyrosolvens C7 TaxID=1330534 RepID=U4R009_9FIRM|nr:CPBP family intramembrane glutamic endopeptidase [Ruminiclostridium papyrosolvens]EPR10080.1 CAAX amino terminal protease [Ruminiclostridium papyrosolvens C7]
MKKYLIMVGNLLIYVVTYFLIIKSLVYIGKGYILPRPGIGPWLNRNSLVVTVTSDLIQFTIFYFVFKKFKGINLLKHVKLTEKISMKNFAVIFVIGLASGFFTSSVFKLPFITERYPDLINIMKFMFIDGGTVIVFTCFLLVGSVYKEILFRGLIFNELRDKLPVVAAVIIQGLMYGLMFFNMNVPLIAYGFLGAVLFVTLYLLVKSLWASVIAQASCQGIMYILMRTEDSILNKGTAWPAIAISFVIIVAGVIYLTKINKPKNALSNFASAR